MSRNKRRGWTISGTDLKISVRATRQHDRCRPFNPMFYLWNTAHCSSGYYWVGGRGTQPVNETGWHTLTGTVNNRQVSRGNHHILPLTMKYCCRFPALRELTVRLIVRVLTVCSCTGRAVPRNTEVKCRLSRPPPLTMGGHLATECRWWRWWDSQALKGWSSYAGITRLRPLTGALSLWVSSPSSGLWHKKCRDSTRGSNKWKSVAGNQWEEWS